MSMMIHCGANYCTRNDIDNLTTPPSTSTHFPIPHSYALDTTTKALAASGYPVKSAEYAIWPALGEPNEGLRLFALLTLDTPSFDPNYEIQLGVRNAHDMSSSLKALLATHCFVCDNLTLSGAGTSMELARKNTRYAMRDLPRLAAARLGNLSLQIHNEENRMSAYRMRVLTNTLAESLILRALMIGAVSNAARVRDIHNHWTRSDGCGGHDHSDFREPTVARLLNCFTETEREQAELGRASSLLTAPTRHAKLIHLLDAATPSLTT